MSAPSYWASEGLASAPVSTALGPIPSNLDVLVVGGGIVGLTLATALVDKGCAVGVVDASPIGVGVTGQSTAKATIGTGLRVDTINRRHGSQAAAEYLDAAQTGLDWIASHLAGHAATHSHRVDHALYTSTASGVERLDSHLELVRALGVQVKDDCEVDLPGVRAAIAYPDQLIIQPFEYLRSLMDRLVERGVSIQTGLTVDRAHGGHIETTEGDIAAAHVVMATHVPIGWLPATLPWQQVRHYAAVVRGTKVAPTALDIDEGWSTRPVVGKSDLSVVLAGSHPTGDPPPADPSPTVRLETWAKETLDGEIIASWSSQDVTTTDDVPLVGRIGPGHTPFTATGFGGWGIAHGTAAALDLAERITGEKHLWEFWDLSPTRLLGMTPAMGRQGVSAAASFVGRQVHRYSEQGEKSVLQRGDAEVISRGGRSIARSVAADGSLHELDATCTHMGCLVQWNPTEQSWDCPCHGSRFSTSGDVLHGPATRPLAPAESPVPE